MTDRYGSGAAFLLGSGLPDKSDLDLATGNVDMIQVKRQYINEALKG